MLADGSGLLPRVANDSKSLGVRVEGETNGTPDIAVQDGMVRPGREGMSVSPSPEYLPFFLIPRRFKHVQFQRPGVAKGSDLMICWHRGDGPFEDGAFADGLLFFREPENNPFHGVISPATEVPLEEYRTALARTQADWKASPWPWKEEAK
jgi:hypothetical protein